MNFCHDFYLNGIYFLTTQTFILAETSGCNFIITSYTPIDSIGLSRITASFSTSEIASWFSASIISAALMLPYSLSSSWAATGMVIDIPFRRLLKFKASSFSRWRRLTTLLASCSIFFILVDVAGMASLNSDQAKQFRYPSYQIYPHLASRLLPSSSLRSECYTCILKYYLV